jgi:hypothetical protein
MILVALKETNYVFFYKKGGKIMVFDRIKNIFFGDMDDYEISYYSEKLSKDILKNKKRKIYDYEENDDFNDFDKYRNLDFIYDEANINSFLKQKKCYNDFQTLLFKLIDERNLKDSDVYNKVHIDRRLFHKIRNDNSYHPSKETILLLGFSMELSILEMEQLLDSASYSLPKNNNFDLIIRYCFVNQIYNIYDVNELLDKFNCELFNY